MRKYISNFLSAKESSSYSAFFRIILASFGLVYLFAVRHSVIELFGEYGFTGWELGRLKLIKHLPHISDLARLLNKVGLSADQTVYLLFYVFALSLFALLLGFGTRFAAIVAWCMSFFLYYAGISTINGMGSVFHIGLFYLMIMPSNRTFSLDAYFFKRVKSLEVKSFTRKLLQFQLALLYLSTGLEKSVGGQWWNGEAIWRSLNMPIYRHFDMSWTCNYPTILTIVGISTLVMEIGYIIFVWIKKIRAVWLAIIMTMHLFIGLFMNLEFFAAIMVLVNIGAFGPEVYKDLTAYKLKKRKLADEKTPVLTGLDPIPVLQNQQTPN